MKRAEIEKLFEELKELAGLDYAITETDWYGDCQTCVMSEISMEYGTNVTGIWLKHWEEGMNAGGSIEEQDTIYIAHNLTDEQAEKIMEYLNENLYQGFDYEPTKCITIEVDRLK